MTGKKKPLFSITKPKNIYIAYIGENLEQLPAMKGDSSIL